LTKGKEEIFFCKDYRAAVRLPTGHHNTSTTAIQFLPDPKAFAKSDDEEDVELEVDVQPEDDDDTAPIKSTTSALAKRQGAFYRITWPCQPKVLSQNGQLRGWRKLLDISQS